MLRRMDARELAAWRAFWRVDPWGDQRADLRQGVLASLVASMAGAKGKPPEPADFMTHPDPPPPAAGPGAAPGPVQQMLVRAHNRREAETRRS